MLELVADVFSSLHVLPVQECWDVTLNDFWLLEYRLSWLTLALCTFPLRNCCAYYCLLLKITRTNELEREINAKRLRHFVENGLPNPTAIPQSLLVKRLGTDMLHALDSEEASECLASIAGFSALLKTNNETYDEHISRTYGALQRLLTEEIPCRNNFQVIKESIKLFEKFGEERGECVVRYIRGRVDNAIQVIHQYPRDIDIRCTLSEAGEAEIFRNAMIIGKFGKSAPDLIFESLDTILFGLGAVVEYFDGELQRCGIESLSSVLDVCFDNYNPNKSEDYRERAFVQVERVISLILNAHKDGRSISAESSRAIRGALLMVGKVMLMYSKKSYPGMDELIQNLATIATKYCDFDNVHIFEALQEMLPAIAHVSAEGKLSEKYRPVCSNYFFRVASSDQLESSLRENALIALGEVAAALNAERFRPYVSKALDAASKLLQNPEIYGVTAMRFVIKIAKVTDRNHRGFAELTRHRLIYLILRESLSEQLFTALKAVIDVVPDLHGHMQSSIIRKAVSVLAENMPDKAARCMAPFDSNYKLPAFLCREIFSDALDADKFNSSVFELAQACDIRETNGFVPKSFDRPDDDDLLQNSKETLDAVSVALKTLCMFDLSVLRVSGLSRFANHYVMRFIESPNVRIRWHAVRACITLMQRAVKDVDGVRKIQNSASLYYSSIFMVLTQIVSLAIVDPSPKVRVRALTSLDNESLHPFLAQPEALFPLSLCLYDEAFEVRKKAAILLPKLRKLNAAEVLPILREFIYHLLAVMQSSWKSFMGLRCQATELMQSLVIRDFPLLDLYGQNIAEALVNLLESQLTVLPKADTNFIVPVLHTIADFAVTSSADFQRYSKRLMRLLIDAILEVKSAGVEFRKAALRALSRVIQNTGHVIKPYDCDSRLMSSLINILKSENDDGIRIQTLELIGVIGAVNPDREDIKYATLPNMNVSEIHRGLSLAKPWEERSYIRHGHSSVGRVGISYDAKGGPSVPDAHAPPTHRVQQQGSCRDALSHSNRRPMVLCESDSLIQPQQAPVFSNSALGNELSWVTCAAEKDIPVWARDSLLTESLVGRLDHPYTSQEMYYPSAVLDVLHKIVSNSRYTPQHLDAVETIVHVVRIIKSLDRCDMFLPAIVPRILWMLRPLRGGNRVSFTDYHTALFNQLSAMVTDVKADYADFLLDTVTLCHEYLTVADLQCRRRSVIPIVTFLKCMRKEIGARFRPYAIYMLESMIVALIQDRSHHDGNTRHIILAVQSFGKFVEQYLFVIIPALVFVVEDPKSCSCSRSAGLEAMGSLLRECSGHRELLSTVIHPLVRLLAHRGRIKRDTARTTRSENTDSGSSSDAPLFKNGMAMCMDADYSCEHDNENIYPLAADVLRQVALVYPSEFVAFVPLIAKALVASDPSRTTEAEQELERQLRHSNSIVASFVLGPSKDRLSEESDASGDRDFPWTSSIANFERRASEPALKTTGKHETRGGELTKLFEVPHGIGEQDWITWIDCIASGLIRESQYGSIRAVLMLRDRYRQFTRELFNAAFLSCWTCLKSEEQQIIVGSLRTALLSPTMPLKAKQMLLDLAEFMDHDERPLPLPADLLATAAVEVGAFAKALRHKENLYRAVSTANSMKKIMSGSSGLIEIYNHLGHTVSANGTVNHFCETATDDQARAIKLEFSETVNVLSDASDEYQQALDNLPAEVDISSVDIDSEEIGRLLFVQYADDDSANEPQDESLPFPESTGATADSRRVELVAKLGRLNRGERVRDLKWFLTISQLRCLNGLGEWRRMEDMMQKSWTDSKQNRAAQQCLATVGKGASVAFDLSKWEEFRERVHAICNDTFEDHFYRSLLYIHDGTKNGRMLDEAEHRIELARKLLDAGLTTRALEGYPRAYLDFLNAQHLVEMNEMISHIRHSPTLSDQIRLQREWDARLQEVRPDYRTWYRLLMIRALAIDKKHSKEHWLNFATKCRKDDRAAMATEALRMLVMNLAQGKKEKEKENEEEDSVWEEFWSLTGNEVPPVNEWSVDMFKKIPDLSVQFACIKQLWALGYKDDAFWHLDACTRPNSPALRRLERGPHCSEIAQMPLKMHKAGEREGLLLAEIYLKLAKWSKKLAGSSTSNAKFQKHQSLGYAWAATRSSPNWYKPWHFWAVLNDDEVKKHVEVVVGPSEEHSSGLPGSSSRRRRRIQFDPARHSMRQFKHYLVNAVEGFFHAIRQGGKTSLEDSLTLLTLWFDFGSDSEIKTIFRRGFEGSSPDLWLDVVPQIIARLHVPHVQEGIKSLLVGLGRSHPHIVVFPLTVATLSPGQSQQQDVRRKHAKVILSEIRKTHRDIVTQSAVMSEELNRVAVLSHEFWYDRIEEASKLFYGEHRIDRMIECLQPLHDALNEANHETDMEKEFVDEFGADLASAYRGCEEWLELTKRISNEQAISEAQQEECRQVIENAWTRYFDVFRKIQKKQATLVTLHLNAASPKLAGYENLALVVPGTYRPFGGETITICRFEHRLDILQSKQRPRRLSLLGSNGVWYTFLLKGHDDLRQDERVMQVFGLINQHLARSDQRSVRQGGELKRYAVVAVSSNAGLIEWVPRCDTMHALVKEFRENRKIMPNIEHKVMGRVAPEPERLPLLHKIDVFEFMLSNTGGRDISRVLWLKSRNSEMWLDRRTNFARTLATASIAGYILGLGDRHPSNIMIERSSGRVMHIDFGDCFEVAMRREKYPETVPFRLTRMLVQALEPCLIHGHFRHMAIAAMKVLRQENTSAALHAMMEAFIHDPLIRHKLLDGRDVERAGTRGRKSAYQGVNHPGRSDFARRYSQVGSLHELALEYNGLQDCGDPILMQHENPSQKNREMRNQAFRNNGMPPQLAGKAETRATEAIDRVLDKLAGLDFPDANEPVEVEAQVDRLIDEARSAENLCQLFPGWVAPW